MIRKMPPFLLSLVLSWSGFTSQSAFAITEEQRQALYQLKQSQQDAFFKLEGENNPIQPVKSVTIVLQSGTYLIDYRLGGGSEGEVYHATKSEEEFALKVYKSNHLEPIQKDMLAQNKCIDSAAFCNLPIAVDMEQHISVFPLLHKMPKEEEWSRELFDRVMDFYNKLEAALAADGLRLNDRHEENIMWATPETKEMKAIDFGALQEL